MTSVCEAAHVFEPVSCALGNPGMLLDNDFNHRYGILYDRFKAEAYWWVVVTLIRRTVLVRLMVALCIVLDFT